MENGRLVDITPEEFREQCKKRIREHGLYHAVEEELDEIVGISHALRYLQFSETIERSQTILELISISEEQNNSEQGISGKWIVLENCSNSGIYCSKCNIKIFDCPMKPKKKLSNFCPNCGSKNDQFYNPSTHRFMN